MTFVKLIWSNRSLSEYERLLEYLLEEWGEKITLRTAADIDRNVNRIINTPEQFPVS